MRKIITITFVTMDGVMQGPGGREEDASGGFAYGGWQMAYGDEMTDKILKEYGTIPFELLMGRRTYDIWAAFWPHHPEIDPFGKPFNSTKKYVVSDAPMETPWNNSVLVTGSDVVAQIQKLKEMDAPDLWVWGSGNLIQTFLKNNLIDRMHIWTHPLTIGTGKKLFAEGTQPQNFELVDSKTSTDGVTLATYEPKGALEIKR